MLRDIQTFRSTYSSSLDYIGNYLNRRNASLRETEVFKSGLQGFMADRFGTNSGTYTNAIAAFESRAARASTPHRKSSDLVESLPPNVQGVVHDTEEALQASASYDAFSEELHQIEQEVLDAEWSLEEKEQALLYLVITDESLAFLDQNPHLIANAQATARINGAPTANSDDDDEEESSWWNCVSGTVGTMLAHATAGVGVGCGTGAVINGPQGCAVGAGIGGTVGVVSGGLSGAADHCGSYM